MNDSTEIIERKLSSIKSDIGLNLFIARKALQLSHLDLVELTGLTRPIISTIENGTANPTLTSIIKLSSNLFISNDMLMMTGTKFEVLQKLLKQSFANYMLHESELYVPKKLWNNLIKYSAADSRNKIGKIAHNCRDILSINLPDQDKSSSQNMILGATLGVIYQSDGFNTGLNFGAWLGKNFC